MKDTLTEIRLLSANVAVISDEEKQYYDTDEIMQITISGKSNALHEFYEQVYHASDCTFNRAEVYPNLNEAHQQMTIYSLLEEKDTVKMHLRSYGVLNLHLWRL